jgi:hypothetical protein
MQEVTDRDIERFQASFAPWGYRDIDKALTAYREAGKTDDDLREAVEEFSDSVLGTDTKLENIDVCFVAFDTLQQEARTEIENATGKDISNDEPYSSVTVYGNYMCTDFDGSNEARIATKSLIDTMKEKSEVVEWYYNAL